MAVNRKSNKKRRRVVLVAPSPPPYGGMANQAKLLAKHLEGAGVRVIEVPTNRSVDFLEKIVAGVPGLRTVTRSMFFGIRLVIAALRCDVLHVLAASNLYFFVNVIPALYLARVLRKRVIINYRGGEAKTFFASRGKWAIETLRLATEVTVPSLYLKDIFSSMGIETKVVPNLAELDVFDYRPPGASERTRYVCTRNFDPYYDVRTAVRAFCIVKKTLANAELVLVGDGSERNEIEKLVGELGLNGSVCFRGAVSPGEMPTQLENADIFINSSIVDNYPISILEAFASGLPVATTSAGGIPYLVEDGESGLLSPPGDAEKLAKSMLRLAQDLDLCRRLAEAGRKIAERHSWENVWPLLRESYGWPDDG